MNNISRDIPALTGLRFVAAFYVFLFHIHIRMPLTENTFLAGIIGQGAIGMTIFFVLSNEKVLQYNNTVPKRSPEGKLGNVRRVSCKVLV